MGTAPGCAKEELSVERDSTILLVCRCSMAGQPMSTTIVMTESHTRNERQRFAENLEALLRPGADVYFSADVETDGPIPGPYSMLSFALVPAGVFDGQT